MAHGEGNDAAPTAPNDAAPTVAVPRMPRSPPRMSPGVTAAPGEEVWCAICLLDDARTFRAEREPSGLMCGHMFCGPCIHQWLAEHSRQCPTCQKHVHPSPRSVIRMYM